MKRRTEIIVRTDRVLIVQRKNGSRLVWCRQCAEQIWMLTPEAAAVLVGVSTRAIYHWMETDEIHFSDPPGGPLLVCPRSLNRALENINA